MKRFHYDSPVFIITVMYLHIALGVYDNRNFCSLVVSLAFD